jgi:fructosamine-3-kinase
VSVLGRAVRRAARLGPAVERVELDDGRTVVVKTGAGLAAEAAGLRWLAVPGGPLVPSVLAEEPLVTTAVPDGAPSPVAAEEFGRALAVVHAAGAPAFGAPPPGGPADATIGAAPMRNVPAPAWPAWYAADRLLPHAGALTAAQRADLDAVVERIDALAGAPEPPARLHGDLWSGNVLWAPDGAWLIDPAAHGGHRETDLAMLALFGCPHLDRVLAAYDEAAPLAGGWRGRVPLHQLFPLLVHARLFGGGYGTQAAAAARAALRAER